ncbi:hypothetical protein AVEN_26655-1 [Araneus ventricosus]|uniref:Uncharacterized protein n=1 Tax=Araneus ventricosus TaxID=182803 RepID=A0A4Y2PV12_ARAVE|nr:hypothetical protein AVEN_26655-1 [Araneus ventricosus]
MKRLRKLLAEVDTDEDPDFDNEGNGPEDVLEETFSDHESFCEHDTESEEDGDYGNEEKEDGKMLLPLLSLPWLEMPARFQKECFDCFNRINRH